MTANARLDALKAAAVTIPFIRFFVRDVSVRSALGLEGLRLEISLAVSAAKQHEASLGAFLQAAAARLRTSRTSALAPILSRREQAAFDRLVAEFDARGAGDPHLGAVSFSDGEIDQSVAICIPELGEACAFAEALARDLMAREGLSMPKIRWTTVSASALEATCLHADEYLHRADIVTLGLPAEGFGERDLYAVPYMLAHELICHATQGVLGPGVRRASGRGCAWSDGWMDRLAYDQTVSRLADEQSLPTWIQEADSHVAQSAERQHVLRDVPASKAEETDMRAREEAKRARYDLMRALAAFLSDEAAEAELLSFSLRYNAQNIPFEDRAGLVVGMFVHLQAPTGPAAVVAAVMAFLRGGDLAELHRALAI